MAEISTDLGRRVWWVDAFVGEGARGNPAVVVLLESDLASTNCQQIAAELSVAETAFLRRGRDTWELRCFTPTVEVDLFGHASLAALHVLFRELQISAQEVVLATRTAPLAGRSEGRQLVIELPRHEVADTDRDALERALGRVERAWTTEAGDVVALLDSFDALCALDPDTVELFLVPASLVIAVAEGGIDSDLAVRVFAPRLGVREDAATGRAMCALAPIWHERSGEERLLCRQISTRGGVLAAALYDDHVEVMGRARTFLSGSLWT
jgi:predicted PhzF superfamily epimerase YddE/YHI9